MPPKRPPEVNTLLPLQVITRLPENSSAITLLYFNRLRVLVEEFCKNEFAGNALFFLIFWPFVGLFVYEAATALFWL